MVVLVEFGGTKVKVALFCLLIQEGVLKYDVFLETLTCTNECMGDVDAIFKGGLLKKLKHLLHILVLDLRYRRFHPPSLH